MKHQSKLTNKEEQALGAEHKAGQQSIREFATPEELLRHDARQTLLPPAIEQKLVQSSAGLQKPKRSWWQRLFE